MTKRLLKKVKKIKKTKKTRKVAPPVIHKIFDVKDSLCRKCYQCWEGECRAYSFPHSAEERAQREVNPTGLCQVKNAVAHKVARETCATKRQVNKFLEKNGVYLKAGILWRTADHTMVTGYVEKVPSGVYHVSIHV